MLQEEPITPESWELALGGLSKSFKASVEAMVGGLKHSDVVSVFFTKHATAAFLEAFAGVFQATKKAMAAIPADYEKYVEQKAVQSLKATMFNRQTHQNACGLMDSISVATGFLQDRVFSWLIPISVIFVFSTNPHACQVQDIIKNCAHMLSGRQLTGLKEHEEDVKKLRLYTTTVHCVNMIVHKMATKSARERSALSRELFDLLSSFCVCRCFLFPVGIPHCFQLLFWTKKKRFRCDYSVSLSFSNIQYQVSKGLWTQRHVSN